MFKSSITMRLTAIAVLAIVIIFAGSGAWIFTQTEKQLVEATMEDIRLKTDLAVANVSETFAIAEQVAKQGAQDKNIRKYLKEVNNHSQITSHQLYSTVNQTLIDYNNSFDKLFFIWIANDRANFFIDSTEYVSEVGYEAASRPWYRLALDTDGVAFTSPYEDVGSGELVVSGITALRDENGEAFGFISADVSLEAIPEIMETYKIGEKGTNFLIGRDGAFIYSETEEHVSEKMNIKDISELKTYADSVLLGNQGIDEVRYDNKDYIVAYEPLEINGWGIIQLVDEKEAQAELNQFTLIVLLIFIFGALVLVSIIFISIYRTIKPIKIATEHAKKLGEGNFTVDVPEKFKNRKDEIGDLSKAFNSMTINFRKLIGEIMESAEQVSAASEQLSATSDAVSHSSGEVAQTIEEIAKGATEQAQSTELGAIKTSELGDLIEDNQGHMSNLNVASKDVVNLVDDGLKIVSGLTQKTKDTNDAAKEIFNVIKKTDESTGKIGEASNVIASIAQQTNLLALNAAIEAARAGEAGKGFAVVADEIRKLAEQSTESTKEIDEIVQELIESSSLAVETINEVNRIILEQVESVKQTENRYQEIFKAIEISAEAIENLNASEKNMETKKAEILDTIQSLSAIAEENAASTEEASASVTEQTTSMEQIVDASRSLSHLAEELNKSTQKFKVR